MLFIALPGLAHDPPVFEDYFIDASLRVDYFHIADAESEIFTLDQIYKQGRFAGNPKQLIEPYDLGLYRAEVYDAASNRLIFTKGFNSYCGEYRTTGPAMEGIKRSYHESILMPFPKKPVRLVLTSSDRDNVRRPIWTQTIDPDDYHIISEKMDTNDQIFELVKNGDPHHTVDLLILAEGYSQAEAKKCRADLQRFAKIFLDWEPYKSHRNLFNIYGIYRPTVESGIDQPRQGIYKKSALSTTFNSFDSPRYILTEDNKTMRDMAAQVPYDAIVIMINGERYGGGGIYNLYTTFTADNERSDFLLHHEFGHSFAALADEYYTSQVSYDEFYKPGVEPRAYNLTALLDPQNIKWKKYLTPGIKIPTDWNKQVFDSLTQLSSQVNADKSEKITTLREAGKSAEEIAAAEKKFDQHIQEIRAETDRFFSEHPMRGKTGAFEGGGYVGEGFYRPTINSLMHRFTDDERKFYPVNTEGIMRVVRYYTER